MYKVTREEDVNVFDGDTYLPQENYPPTVAQAADTPPGAGSRRPAAVAGPVADGRHRLRTAWARCTRCT